MTSTILIYVQHSNIKQAPLVGGFCLVAVNNKGQAEKKLHEAVLVSQGASPEEALFQSVTEALKRVRSKDTPVIVLHESLKITEALQARLLEVNVKALCQYNYSGFAYWYQLPLWEANKKAEELLTLKRLQRA